ncbi:MAG: DUF5706 domain-containing protein [Planctomycetaceae bacterium]
MGAEGSATDVHVPTLEYYSIHATLHHSIELADKKAGFVIAAVGALLAYLHHEPGVQWIQNPAQWRLSEACLFVADLGLVASTICSLLVVFPRLEGSMSGVVFWEAILQNQTASKYADVLVNMKSGDLSRKLLEHCFELAKICTTKYRCLQWAFVAGVIGFAASVLLLGSR